MRVAHRAFLQWHQRSRKESGKGTQNISHEVMLRCWDEHRWKSTQDSFFLSPLCQIGPEQTEDDFGWGESRGRQTVVRHDGSKPGAMLEHYSPQLHTDIAAPPLWDLSPLLTSSACQSKVHALSVCEAPAVHMCGKCGDKHHTFIMYTENMSHHSDR